MGPVFWRAVADSWKSEEGDGRIAVWCKAPFEMQDDIVSSDPETFFVPPYVGPSGWIGIRLDGEVEWGMVADLLEQGYRMVAPKRAIAQLDEE